MRKMFLLCCVWVFIFPIKSEAEEVERTNVIMMVMDGASSSAVTLARLYKGEPLALDGILTGGVKTYSASSAATDSAAAATALATGHKTEEHYLGLLPTRVQMSGVDAITKQNRAKPVANLLEGARLSGKATGLVATAEIQHATPAGYSAHVSHRNRFAEIAEQQINQEIDVVLGGGKKNLKGPLVDQIKREVYQFVETSEELQNARGSERIWGSFADGGMAYNMDRKTLAPTEPSLAEMTETALATLTKDPDGFFLFVEGSKVDWAAHQQDPIGMISEILAFDEAVKVAVDFAKQDGKTLVVAVADHGNSGLSIGNKDTSKNYASQPDRAFVAPLKKATLTLEGARQQLKKNRSNMKAVARAYGLDGLSKKQIRSLQSSKDLDQRMTSLLAERALLGFTTYGHTGEDVFLYSFGPNAISGLVENTNIADRLATSMGFQLDVVSEELFTDLNTAFEERGFIIKMENDQSDRLLAERGSLQVELTANRNEAMMAGQKIILPGIIIFSGDKFYGPKKILEYIK